MNPAEAMRMMAGHASAVADASVATVEPLMTAASHAAGTVRLMALTSGDQVDIRVMQRANGIRISVTGPKAKRYRSVITSELDRLHPATVAELRTQITRKIR
jgi:hypothetical protein